MKNGQQIQWDIVSELYQRVVNCWHIYLLLATIIVFFYMYICLL